MGKKAKNIKLLFNRVKLLILDVDGVLTKGEIIYGSSGEEYKSFNVKDGLGVFLLMSSGIKTILLTAKESKAARRRAEDMGADIYAGILPKESLLPQIRERYNVSNEDICFVGDDLIDIGVMSKVGVPVAVYDAPDEVKNISLYVTKKRGGEGAVREVVEKILKSKGMWKTAVNSLFSLPPLKDLPSR